MICPHQNTEPRLRTLSNQTTAVVIQCLFCGTALKCEHKSKHNVGALVPYDESLVEKFQQAQKNEWELLHADRERAAAESVIKDEEWRAKYNEHLKSEKWRELRDRTMRRVNYICEGCGRDTARHVHHMTYAHMGDEFLFELIAVCTTCHQKIHPHKEIKKW